MIKRLLTISVFFWSTILLAQDCSDTLSCYAEYAYPSGFEIGIEKIWESTLLNAANSTISPIISYDVDSCKTELLFINDLSEMVIYNHIDYNYLNYDIEYSEVSPTNISCFSHNGIINTFYTSEDDTKNEHRSKLISINSSDGTPNWISEKITERNNSAIADFDNDGIAEIYFGNSIYSSATGKLIIDGSLGIGGRGGFFQNSVAGNFDEDDELELAAGYTIYDLDFSSGDPTMISKNISIDGGYYDGNTIMADVDENGILDAIVLAYHSNGKQIIYAYSLTSDTINLIAQSILELDFYIYPSPIATKIYEGDSIHIIFNIPDALVSYSYNGSDKFIKDWEISIEEGPGTISPTAYDLNNDGYKEIIIRDEKRLKIIDLSLGYPKLLINSECRSGTGFEKPIVSDIDNDGDADICVFCSHDDGDKLTVFSQPDSLPGWTPSRSIWNQYNYHPLYINDDMTIPQYMENPATYKNGRYNNFGVQATLLDDDGMYKTAAASLYGEIDCIDYDIDQGIYSVDYHIYNREDASKATEDSLMVSFYDGDPDADGMLLDTVIIHTTLDKGSTISGQLDLTTSSLDQLFMVVNTSGKSGSTFEDSDYLQLECDYTDNIAQAGYVPQVEQESITICDDETYDFYGSILSESGDYDYSLQSTSGCDSIIHLLSLTVNNCNETTDCTDTLSCYAEYAYPSGFEIGIEKIWESDENDSGLYFFNPIAVLNPNNCSTDILFIKYLNSLNQYNLENSNSSIYSIEYSSTAPTNVCSNVENGNRYFYYASDNLFFSENKNKVIKLDDKGSMIWVSDSSFYDLQVSHDVNLLVSDINNDGFSEIIAGNKIFDSESGINVLKGSFGKGGSKLNVVVGDFDNDSILELGAGYTVYDVEINNRMDIRDNSIFPKNINIEGAFYDGNTVSSDLDEDGKLDLIVLGAIENQGLILYAYNFDLQNPNLIASTQIMLNNPFGVSKPLVTRLDKQGSPKIIFSIPNYLVCYGYDGTKELKLQWKFPITEDLGTISITSYDLNNDGNYEIILRDEESLNIINIKNGSPEVIQNIECKSWTFHEGPIVSDLNGDNYADICVVCADNDKYKLTVFSQPDSLPGWTPSRSIWNQYNYHPLYINDDMTIPQYMENPATYKNGRYNNFGVQATLLDDDGMYKTSAASLYGEIDCIDYDIDQGIYRVDYDIYNREDASKATEDSLMVSFYDGDPDADGMLLDTVIIHTTLDKGGTISEQLDLTTSSLDQLFMVVNTSGKAGSTFEDSDYLQLECDYTDNIAQAGYVPQVEQESITICDDETYDFYGSILSESGDYDYRLQSTSGCDSIIHLLSLTVNNCNETTDCSDTLSCYAEYAYPSGFEIGIEKIWESDENVQFQNNPLIEYQCLDSYPTIYDYEGETALNSFQFNSNEAIKSISTGKALSKPCGFAIADINRDGFSEVIVSLKNDFSTDINNKKIAAYDQSGSLLWTSSESVWMGFAGSTEIFISDLNGDSVPEIIVYNKVFNAENGELLVKLDDRPIGFVNSTIVIGNFDSDLELEFAAGNTIFDIEINNLNGTSGNSIIPHSLELNGVVFDGYTSMADVDTDGLIEVVVSALSQTNKSKIIAFRKVGAELKVVAETEDSIFKESSLGPLLIVNSNQGVYPSIIVSDVGKLYSFKYNENDKFEFQWQYDIDEDHDGIRPIAYDLNNDGNKEIVFRDQSHLSILDLSTNSPVLVGVSECMSGTEIENPIVADLDNDGDADICVTCINEGLPKLTVFSQPDSLPGWTPSRSIWNQYNYHPLYINDDMTIPQYMENPATYKNGRYNNFGVQATLLDDDGMYKTSAASLYGEIDCIDYDIDQGIYSVDYHIYNREDASKATEDSLMVSFYDGDPDAGGMLLDTVIIHTTLDKGSTISGQLDLTTSSLDQLFMVVNTSGKAGSTFEDSDYLQLECDYTDNITQAGYVPQVEQIEAATCSDTPHDFYGTMLSTSGTYQHVLQDMKSCDSILVMLDLTVRDTININLTEEACSSYEWAGETYKTSGQYTRMDTSVDGCDSLTTLDLTIQSSYEASETQSVCDSIIWKGTTYRESGTYSFSGQSIYGCDSIITLNLTVNSSYDEVVNHSACDSYTWNGTTYTESGIYPYATLSSQGCDSLITLDLTINDVLKSTETVEECDRYDWNGETYTESGVYEQTFTSVQGCDSVAVLDLTLHRSILINESMQACDSVLWNGDWLHESGWYSKDTLTAKGCDSTIALLLTVHKSYDEVVNHSACDSYTWNGTTYTESGIYPYATVSSQGCDSLVTLDLTINDVLKSTETVEECDGYDWHGETYTQSGVYEQTFTSVQGCDSIAVLDLTLHRSILINESMQACDSVLWNGTTYMESGIYSHEAQSITGCDSITRLDLTLHQAQNEVISMSSCEPIEWNGAFYDASGSYTYMTTTIHGCDSMTVLDLSIEDDYHISETLEECDEVLWHGISYVESGIYLDTILTASGCDTIYTLDLQVTPSYAIADTIISKENYLWSVNEATYSRSGIYQEVYESRYACDSIHYLYLTIEDIQKRTDVTYPNIIRPGGANGYFLLYPPESIVSLVIYDRWGTEVYVHRSGSLGWDGTSHGRSVIPGVYVWQAVIKEANGQLVKKAGDITVLGK